MVYTDSWCGEPLFPKPYYALRGFLLRLYISGSMDTTKRRRRFVRLLTTSLAVAITLVATTNAGAQTGIAFGSVVRLEERADSERQSWIPDANRTRYFYTPSAFALGPGRGYLSQRFLLLSSFGIGILPFLDVELGVVLPTGRARCCS